MLHASLNTEYFNILLYGHIIYDFGHKLLSEFKTSIISV